MSIKRLPRPLQLAIANAAHQRSPSLSLNCCCPLDNLMCSICFDILSFPVTLPCGHNFDRGCILTAWTHTSSSPRRATVQQRGNLCPLCRQQTHIYPAEQLQVNLLLKELIASLYPAEMQCAATPMKQQSPRVTLLPVLSPRANGGALTTNTAASAFRRRPSLRTFSSFVYVCTASVTDPPGFVLAVLLLLILLATACSPQPATAPPAASAMVMFDTMDRVCNGLSLMIHRISMQMDQLDQLSPWIRLISQPPNMERLETIWRKKNQVFYRLLGDDKKSLATNQKSQRKRVQSAIQAKRIMANSVFLFIVHGAHVLSLYFLLPMSECTDDDDKVG